MLLYLEYHHNQKLKMQVMSDWLIAKLKDGSKVLLDWDNTIVNRENYYTNELHFGVHMDQVPMDEHDLSEKLSNIDAIGLHVYCETDDDQIVTITSPVKLTFADEAYGPVKTFEIPIEKVFQNGYIDVLR